MAIRTLNEWHITHMNGVTENILAENVVEAINNLATPITVSDINRLEATARDVRAFISDIAPVAWTTEVSPSAALSAGCFVFPSSGEAEDGSSISIAASPSPAYTFDHWELDGASIGTDRLVTTTVSAPSSGEAVKYVAVFTAVPQS